MIHVPDVVSLEGLWIRVTFTDGAVKEIDLSELLAAGGVFAPIYAQRETFEQVAVNPETGRSSGRGMSTWTPKSSMAATSRRQVIRSSAGPSESR